MILPAELRHKEQIISLWSGAFGDKIEDINKYLKTIFEYVLVYEEDGMVLGMLSVLPVSFCDKNGGYIYAVTTHKDYRGQGICNKLMEYVKADGKYDFLVLKPQNEGLFEFYGKMGFEKVSCLSKQEFLVTESAENGCFLRTLNTQEYGIARNSYIDEEIITWDSSMLSFAKDMYDGAFYAIEKDGKSVGIAFLYKNENVVIIKELLAEENESITNFIAKELECDKVEVTFRNPNGKEGFMIYPANINCVYFNIYLD